MLLTKSVAKTGENGFADKVSKALTVALTLCINVVIVFVSNETKSFSFSKLPVRLLFVGPFDLVTVPQSNGIKLTCCCQVSVCHNPPQRSLGPKQVWSHFH